MFRKSLYLRAIILSLIAVSVLAGALPLAAAEPDEGPRFSDVSSDHTFSADIAWLATSGITHGCNPPDNDRFCPDGDVTRAELAAFLHRAYDAWGGDSFTLVADGRFTDVPAGATFAADIEWMASEGITRGCNPPENDLFCPDAPVTRGQAAAFITRSLGLPSSATTRFADVGAAHVFVRAISAVDAHEVTYGCGVNSEGTALFCPDEPVTRGELAAFLHRTDRVADQYLGHDLALVDRPGVVDAQVGEEVEHRFEATGGTPPYRFSSSDLPADLVLGDDGALAGTPKTPGTQDFSVTVEDSQGRKSSAVFTLDATPATLTITTAALTEAIAGTEYVAALEATGGVPPYHWTSDGLPSSLGLSSDGNMSGMVDQRGSYEVTFTVTDSDGASDQTTLVLDASPHAACANVTSIPDSECLAVWKVLTAAMGGDLEDLDGLEGDPPNDEEFCAFLVGCEDGHVTVFSPLGFDEPQLQSGVSPLSSIGVAQENDGPSGRISPAIGDLPYLRILDLEFGLEGSSLGGSLPAEIGNLKLLEVMIIPYHALSGTIPVEIGGLDSIELLVLYDNQLEGPVDVIATELSDTLEALYLGSNGCFTAEPPNAEILDELDPDWDDGCGGQELTVEPTEGSRPDWRAGR